MAKLTALITAPAHPLLKEKLEAKGYKVYDQPAITYEELANVIAEVDGLIVTTRLRIDAAILQKAHRLQWIGRLGSGLELIDVALAEEMGIKVVASPEGNRLAVGEQVLGMILSLLNHLPKATAEVKEGQWIRSANRGTQLSGKTVGIIGFGNTGSAVAQVLAGFNCTILAYDKYKTGFGHQSVREASLEQVCKYSDVITVHLPLTEETHHFVNHHFFEMMARQPLFINASRGKVHHTAAIIAALESKKISGAGLDVLENENLASYSAAEKAELDWLLQQSNVMITPHIGGYSHEAFAAMAQITLEKLDLL